jgi:anti-sigma factor RsiW
MAALLDGELKGWRLRYVRRHVAHCPACGVEYRQQRHARDLLRQNPPRDPVPDAADFFWAKVRNEIQRRGDTPVAVPVPRLSLIDWIWLRPLALPSVAAALVVLLAAVSVLQYRAQPRHAAAPRPASEVLHATAPVPNSVATAFHSEAAGATVIWVSGLPWTPGMTEMQTLFANLDT